MRHQHHHHQPRFARAVLFATLSLAACTPRGPEAPARTVDPLTTSSPEQLFQRGLELARQGDDVRAEQYMTASIERGIDARRVIEPLMTVCIQGSRFGTALRHGLDYLTQYPDDWEMRILVANLLGAVGRADEQQRALEQLIEERPGAATPHFVLALRFLEDGDDAGGSAELRTYLRLAPRGRHARSARMNLRVAERAHMEKERNSTPVQPAQRNRRRGHRRTR